MLSRIHISGSRIASSSVTSSSRRSKPSGGHSIASDLATNTRGGVQADEAAGSRDVAVASADGYTAEARHGQVIAARVAAMTFLRSSIARSFQARACEAAPRGLVPPPSTVGLEDLSNGLCPMSASPPRASGSIEG